MWYQWVTAWTVALWTVQQSKATWSRQLTAGETAGSSQIDQRYCKQKGAIVLAAARAPKKPLAWYTVSIILENAGKTMNQTESVLFLRRKASHHSTKRGELGKLQPSTSSNSNSRNLIRTRPIQWQNGAKAYRWKPRLRSCSDKLCFKIYLKYCPYKRPIRSLLLVLQKGYCFLARPAPVCSNFISEIL